MTNGGGRATSTSTKYTTTNTFHQHEQRTRITDTTMNVKCQSSNVKTEIQMTNNGVKNTNTRVNVKLPAHRAGLPGNEISFLIVPLDPAYKAGFAGHLPAKV